MAFTDTIRRILNYMPGYQASRSRHMGGGLQHASIEVDGENEINRQSDAIATLADARDYIRNNSFAQTILNQLQVNVVGTVGGRLSFSTADESFNEAVNLAWARYSRNCGFSNSETWNRMLKDIVGCLFMNGGDTLLVFDDGQLTGGRGTGKVLAFESDQIANVPEAWFADRYGSKGYTQERGIIYDRFHRQIGYFASMKRGVKEFKFGPKGEATWLTFIDESGEMDTLKRNFILVARTWRPNQGRGVAALDHVLNELRNLDDLGATEISSAQLNTKIGLAITSDSSASDTMAVDALMNGGKVQQPKIKFDAMLRRQSAVLQLPSGKKVESFKTDRPNDRVPEFIMQLQSQIVAVFGLGRQFFTLTPESSFTAHRGAMQMAWQTITAIQRDIEVACNWLASQWFYRQRTTGGISVSQDILDEIDMSTEWSFPKMPEVDSTSYQNTITAALQNGDTDLREIHGPGWRKRITQRRIEREFCEANGEVYPGDRMASGGVVENPMKKESEDGEE